MSKITKEMAFLDKWLVIPPIYRPYVEDKKRPGLYVEDEITGMYKSIIQAAGSQKGENSFMDKLFWPELSERDNMINNGYRILYDTGNLVYHKNY